MGRWFECFPVLSLHYTWQLNLVVAGLVMVGFAKFWHSKSTQYPFHRVMLNTEFILTFETLLALRIIGSWSAAQVLESDGHPVTYQLGDLGKFHRLSKLPFTYLNRMIIIEPAYRAGVWLTRDQMWG